MSLDTAFSSVSTRLQNAKRSSVRASAALWKKQNAADHDRAFAHTGCPSNRYVSAVMDQVLVDLV